jgi:hypothetical protein
MLTAKRRFKLPVGWMDRIAAQSTIIPASGSWLDVEQGWPLFSGVAF